MSNAPSNMSSRFKSIASCCGFFCCCILVDEVKTRLIGAGTNAMAVPQAHAAATIKVEDLIFVSYARKSQRKLCQRKGPARPSSSSNFHVLALLQLLQ
jgi:hypothetical protein